MCDYEKYIENDVFSKLNGISVTDKVEKKNGFNYLSWAFAWGELKKLFPDATYIVYENKDGWNYHTDGRTAWVKVGVTVKGLEHIEMLPVMDYRNNSIALDKITSFDVNKAIQRATAKAIARHGLGLSVFAKEDLISKEELAEYSNTQPVSVSKPANKKVEEKLNKVEKSLVCTDCKKTITDHQGASAKAIANATEKKYGVMLCKACADKRRAKAEAEATPEPTPPEPVIIEEEQLELPFDIC